MYDLSIIGAGWAGFNASLTAQAQGLKVALIDRSSIGGTCLNLGCIPTKTLIQSAKVYSQAKKARTFGIEFSSPVINFNLIQERKNKIISQLRKGMEYSLKGIDFLHAPAEIVSCDTLKIQDKLFKTKFILISTGSEPLELKDLAFDGKKIISSEQALEIREIPRSILIVGGGVIGCEFASLFRLLESRVSLFEIEPQLLPGEDAEVAKKLETIFKKQGIEVFTNRSLTTADTSDYDLVLVCIGRRPRIKDLGLANLKLNTQEDRIWVDEALKTSVPNIYAAGDCTGKIMLAHFAAHQGRIAANNIAHPDRPQAATATNIPSCIFTDPEIATIGLSEDKARQQGMDIKVNKFDFLASGMARILDETEGLIKIISDKKSKKIIGAAIIGPRASELIGILTLGLQAHLEVSQIEKLILAHPTLSEGITEAIRANHAV